MLLIWATVMAHLLERPLKTLHNNKSQNRTFSDTDIMRKACSENPQFTRLCFWSREKNCLALLFHGQHKVVICSLKYRYQIVGVRLIVSLICNQNIRLMWMEPFFITLPPPFNVFYLESRPHWIWSPQPL